VHDSSSRSAGADRPLQVVRDGDRGRFELLDGGDVIGFAPYEVVGDTVVVPHVEIRAERRSHGLGEVLACGLLDQIRASDQRVRPQCRFLAGVIREHAEYADLVADR
jgi:uncharacterized protein